MEFVLIFVVSAIVGFGLGVLAYFPKWYNNGKEDAQKPYYFYFAHAGLWQWIYNRGYNSVQNK